VNQTSVKRNDPCPCGSGKRYKQCCGVHATVTSPAHIVAQAAALVQQGELERAAALLMPITENGEMAFQAAARYWLGLVHYHQGNRDAALQLFRQVTELAPQVAEYRIALGNLLRENGEFDAAIEQHRQALSLSSQMAEAYFNLGESLCAAGRHNETGELFRIATALKPELAPAHISLAKQLLAEKDFVAARHHFEEALRLNPTVTVPYFGLGSALEALGELSRAVEVFRQAAEIAPHEAEVHFNLANLLSKTQQIDAAVAEYQQALTLRPDYGKAWVNLGNLFRVLGQPETALKAYRLALLCKPPSSEAHFNYIKIFSEDFLGNGALLDWHGSLSRAAAFSRADDGKLVSFIICSIDARKFAAVSESIARHFTDTPYEIIPIHDAVSLCEGYNRGVRLSRGDYLAFCHDDVEILAPDFALRLKQHLEEFDLVGVAGTTLLCGSTWADGGFPHLHGMVAHPAEDHGYELMVYGSAARTIPDIQAFDGLFFAVRREVMETLRFDEGLFDGFHLYDLDFTYRAHLAGLRLAVCNDLLLAHHSRGNFGNAWEHYAKIFLKKHRGTLPNKPLAHAVNPAIELPTALKLWEFAAALMENRDQSMAPFTPEEEQALRREIVETPVHSYAKWLETYAPETPQALAELRRQGAALPRRPLISLLMPVYDIAERWLRAALDSVLAQTYAEWELCIADDASTQPHVRTVLEEYRQRDDRIKVIFRPANGHISAASNSALELAGGEYLALLDHDDRLSPDALYHVAAALNRDPAAILLYSDEDKIDEEGRRYDPYFKCAWNPDLMLSHNLVTHLGVYHADTVRSLGGFRLGYEGAQDYDLALRVAEVAGPSRIVHIPRVLYSWRTVAGSTSRGVGEKNYAVAAAVRAIDDALKRRGVAASAAESPLQPGSVRVGYRLPADLPLVSLIVPTRNGYEFLARCVDSILALTDYPAYEILVIDNGSDEPRTLDYLAGLAARGNIRVIRDNSPFNYSALNNAAVKLANGALLGFVNNDIEVLQADWLKEMVSHALRPEIGAVGARLLYPNDTVQHAGVIVGIGGVAGHIHKGIPHDSTGYVGRALNIQNFSAVTAACLVVRREVFEAAGGFDETNLPVAFSDIDLCLSIEKLGKRNLFTPYATLYHYESATRGYETTPEKVARFQRETAFMKTKWGTEDYPDPAYSPNLSLNSENPFYAFPPRLEKKCSV